MALSKKDILSAQDLKKELVKVPEWGGEVWVRGMTGAERDKYEAAIVQQRGKNQIMNLTNFRARLVCLTVCDEKGNLLFTEAEIKELSLKSASSLQRIFEVASRLSGIGEEDVKELTDGLKENPLGDSTSA